MKMLSIALLLALGMSFGAAPGGHETIPANDGLLAVAGDAAPMKVCSVCHCCFGNCNVKGGTQNAPYGQMEPSYCGSGCEISDDCISDDDLDGAEPADVFADAWASAVAGDRSRLKALAHKYDHVFKINVARGALQVFGCDGKIAAHYPIGTAAAASIAEDM